MNQDTEQSTNSTDDQSDLTLESLYPTLSEQDWERINKTLLFAEAVHLAALVRKDELEAVEEQHPDDPVIHHASRANDRLSISELVTRLAGDYYQRLCDGDQRNQDFEPIAVPFTSIAETVTVRAETIVLDGRKIIATSPISIISTEF